MNRIQELRKKQGMTQQELANKLGLSRSTIAGYETGNSQPDNDTIVHLSFILDSSVDYLLGKTDEYTAAVIITDEDPQLIELHKILKKMSAQGIQKVIDYADLLENSGRYPKQSLWD